MSDRVTKQWIVRPRTDPDLITHLLKSRDITEDAHFFAPNFATDLHDPFLMKDMTKAVERLIAALKAGEPIGIFADYDTDGTPGAALLFDGLRKLGAPPVVYIPTRGEGYGLSRAGIDALKNAGARVVVTIDLGITGKDVAEHARAQGIDLIVTDHHVVQPELFPAAALAVINPKQAACSYPFKELCGGGIAWKLLGALITRLQADAPQQLNGQKPESLLKWSLDLAAISTICDMVPLVGENRVIAKYGLIVLAKTRRVGIQKLIETAGVQPDRISASTVGFQIGPRINAPTRMAAESYTGNARLGPQASVALALLLSQDAAEAQTLAAELQTHNQARQDQLELILNEATERVIKEGLDKKKVILLAGPDWPAGIVGLVASRLMERFGRPAIVLGINGDEAVGSARSIDGLHLVEALQSASQHIKKFGGHTKSAGLTIEMHQIEVAYEKLLAYADSRLSDEQLGPRLYLDAILDPHHDLNEATAVQLGQFAPFGLGNPRPTFLLRNLEVREKRLVGASGQHAKFAFQLPTGRSIAGIAFRFGETGHAVAVGDRVDAAVHLELNEWQDRRHVELHVVDFRPTQEVE